MLELKEYTKEDFKAIFGKNRREVYFFNVWCDKYSIFENKDVFKWITTKMRKFARKSNKNPKDFKITSYLKPLQEYCDYNKVDNPSDLLKENIDDRNKRLVDYLVYLINDKGLNEVSVKNAYQSRIKSFYSARGSPITDGLETEDNGKNINEMNLNREKIRAILNMINNSNYKLASKLQSLLGFRIGDVLKEFPKYKILKYLEHYYIKDFLTIKENIKIKYVFFPKELIKLLQAIFSIEDLTKLDLNADFLKTRNGKMILASEYLRKLKSVASKLYPNESMRTHSFRKYFATQISRINLTKIRSDIGSDVESNFKEHLLGHKVHYSSKVYNQIINDIHQFYELWKPLEASLCIDLEIVNTPNKDILDMREQIIKLEKENKAIHEERTKFKEKINKLEESINKVNEILPNLIESNNFFKNQYNTLLSKITDKEIIETLGLNEIPEKSGKKLDIKLSK